MGEKERIGNVQGEPETQEKRGVPPKLKKEKSRACNGANITPVR